MKGKNTIKFHTFGTHFFIKSMLLKKVIILSLIIAITSCNKTDSKKNTEIVKDSLISNTIKVNHQITKLNPKANKLVENWDEYQKIDELLKQYQSISANDALLNAKELSGLSQQLKDSIRIEKLNNSSVKIRLNVLYNETLRLADMESIPSISEAEVFEENDNILNAFSSLNLKINNIVSQENLNNEVNRFVNEVLSLNDSSKIKDSLKTIKKPI